MSFGSEVNKSIVKVSGQADKVVRNTLMGIYRDTISATPVDTGRLQNNWFTTVGKSTSETRGSSKSGSGSITQAQSVSKKFPMGSDVYFTNNVDYAYYVENGGLHTEPVGMLKRSIEKRL